MFDFKSYQNVAMTDVKYKRKQQSVLFLNKYFTSNVPKIILVHVMAADKRTRGVKIDFKSLSDVKIPW